MYTNPTVSTFKSYFYRDFPYTSNVSDLTKVQDKDISTAMVDTNANINPELFISQDNYTTAYLLLTAHFLSMNLRASSQGINGQFEWLASNKSVGSVSIGTSIPQRMLDNPYFAMLVKTNYGAQYLMMVLPYLCGQIQVPAGSTLA
jgi:hypothetical protein